jgi:hypothetical protein
MQVMCYFQTFHSAPQPNESFNADANIGHGFAIFMANVGALRPYGLRRRLTRALDSTDRPLPFAQRKTEEHRRINENLPQYLSGKGFIASHNDIKL